MHFTSLIGQRILRIRLFRTRATSTNGKVSIVKTLRALFSGEDTELSAAYTHFRKMVDQEQAVVRNATLVAVGRIQEASTNIETAIQENSALTGRTGVNVQSIMVATDHVHKVLKRGVNYTSMLQRVPDRFYRSTSHRGTRGSLGCAFISGFSSKAEEGIRWTSSRHRSMAA